jgi:hypothetical protein
VTTEREIDLIEAYHNGTLADEDRMAFERRLNDDPEFNRLVKEHVWILDGFEGMQMKAFEESLRQRDVRPRRGTGRRWLIMLLILAIAVLLLLLVRERTAPDDVKDTILAEAYYTPPVSLVERSQSQTMPEELTEAFLLYSDEEWEDAAQYFASVEEMEYRAIANYYEAHCRYQMGEFTEAQAMFEGMTSDAQYAERSEWFGVHCLLQTGMTDVAISRLEVIVTDETHFYRDSALELLTGLGSK